MNKNRQFLNSSKKEKIMYEYYFEKLDVWKKSINLSLEIYKITKNFPKEEKFGIVSQLNRAIVSVSSNIVEGLSRKSFKDQARFSTIAFGSLMESLNLIIISNKLNYISESEYYILREKINEVSSKLNALRKTQLSKVGK